MANISAWIDANVAAGKRGQASKVAGAQVREFSATYEKLGAADGDGSVFGIIEIPANAVLLDLKLNCDALVGFSSASLGYYRKNADGTFSDTAKSDGTSAKAVLMSAVDISAGKANGSEQNGLKDVDIANLAQKVWEYLGFSKPDAADTDYALALTGTTAGTAAGTITIRGRYLVG